MVTSSTSSPSEKEIECDLRKNFILNILYECLQLKKNSFFPLELGIGTISYSLKDKHTTDLRPASVLIFQRQGDGGAGGQLDKMKKVVNRVEARVTGMMRREMAVVKMMGNLSTVMMGKARLASWRKMKLTPS